MKDAITVGGPPAEDAVHAMLQFCDATVRTHCASSLRPSLAKGRGEQLRRTGSEAHAWRRAAEGAGRESGGLAQVEGRQEDTEGEGWGELCLISITSLHMRRAYASVAVCHLSMSTLYFIMTLEDLFF